MCRLSAKARLTGRHNNGATAMESEVKAGAPISAIIRCEGRMVAQNTMPPPNTSRQPNRLMPPSPPLPTIRSATPAKAASPHNQ